MEQLPLLAGDAEALGKKFLELLRSIVALRGLAWVAGQLGQDEGDLHHALNKRKRMNARAEWVPWLLQHAPNDDALEFLAALCGRETIPARPVEPERELRALHAALKVELGEGARAAVLATMRRLLRQEADANANVVEIDRARRRDD